MSYYFPPQQKPKRWGSVSDIQYAIRKNSEKIYGIDPDSNVLIMPLFWGFPCLDFSGKNNHGAPEGGVGYHSGGLDFDGTTGYLLIPNDFFVGIASGTFLMRLSPSVASSGSISAFAGDSVSDYAFQFLLTTTNFYAGFYDGVWRRAVATEGSDYSWVINESIQLGVGWDSVSPTVKILFNGQNVGTNYTTAFTQPAKNNLFIARRSSGNFFNGLIDDIRINNIAPTAEQIALFYQRPWDLYRRVGRTYYSVAAAPSIYIPQIMIF